MGEGWRWEETPPLLEETDESAGQWGVWLVAKGVELQEVGQPREGVELQNINVHMYMYAYYEP